MPRISAFYGIVIWMYRPDHPPPHFHASYAGEDAVFEIGTMDVIQGTLSSRAIGLVREWGALHQQELVANWELA